MSVQVDIFLTGPTRDQMLYVKGTHLQLAWLVMFHPSPEDTVAYSFIPCVWWNVLFNSSKIESPDVFPYTDVSEPDCFFHPSVYPHFSVSVDSIERHVVCLGFAESDKESTPMRCITKSWCVWVCLSLMRWFRDTFSSCGKTCVYLGVSECFNNTEVSQTEHKSSFSWLFESHSWLEEECPSVRKYQIFLTVTWFWW